jgi:hypothetical protein
MGRLLETHPRLVAEHRDLIMECIDDADLSIRLRALDIVVGMVSARRLRYSYHGYILKFVYIGQSQESG